MGIAEQPRPITFYTDDGGWLQVSAPLPSVTDGTLIELTLNNQGDRHIMHLQADEALVLYQFLGKQLNVAEVVT